MKAFFVFFLIVIAQMAAYGFDKNKHLLNQLSVVATSLSQAAYFVETNIDTDKDLSDSFNVIDFSDSSSLTESITINNSTGTITLKTKKLANISSALQGTIVTLSPLYYDPETLAKTNFDRDDDHGMHNIDTWLCEIDNSYSKNQFTNINISGRIVNLIALVELKTNSNEISNIFSRYCNIQPVINSQQQDDDDDQED